MGFEILKRQLTSGQERIDTGGEVDADLERHLSSLDHEDLDAPREFHLSAFEVDMYVYEDDQLVVERLETMKQLTLIDDSQFAHKLFSPEAKEVVATRIAEVAERKGVTSLPPEAEALGFRLEFYDSHNLREGYEHMVGLAFLKVPSPDIGGFTPMLAEDENPDDHFTSFAFDPSTQTLSLSTNRGETAMFKIDAVRRRIAYESVAPGGVKTTIDGLYVVNPSAVRALHEIAEGTEGGGVSGGRKASFHYHPMTKVLTTTFEGETTSRQLTLPNWLMLEVLGGEYGNQVLVLRDARGQDFYSRLGSGGWGGAPQRIQDLVILAASPTGYSPGDYSMSIATGESTVGSAWSMQEIIDQTVDDILTAEVREKTAQVPMGSHTVAGFGPDRNGDYLLNSGTGPSTVYYNPGTGFRLGPDWNSGGETSRILSSDAAAGKIVVEASAPIHSHNAEDAHKRETVRWEIQLRFDGADPEASYTTKKL